MPSGRIFLVGNDKGELMPMTEADFVKEADLQALLASYPDLLAGDQIDPEAPRRWLLVAREMPVPGDVDENGRWSLDHLFLDQDGRPTFVECKRASDSRARREVVALMLDYAANGVTYWSMDRLRQAAAETARINGRELDDEIRGLLADPEADLEAYWQTVEKNLRAGRVRLIFVADRTPRELRRLVEFLNEKMSDVEVLAVEVKQFKGQHHRALVPRLVGYSEEARQKKDGDASRTTTNRVAFLAQVPPETVPMFNQMLELSEARGHTIYWGNKGFSIRARLPKAGRLMSFAYGWPTGHFQVYLNYLPIPETEAQAFAKQLLDIGGLRKSGRFTLDMPPGPAAIGHFGEIYECVLAKVDEIVSQY